MHVERAHAPVAGAQQRALEQCPARALVALRGKDGDAELRVLAGARQMRHAVELELFIVDAEYRVTLEVDARNVTAQRYSTDRRAEAQPPVMRVERQEMPQQQSEEHTSELQSHVN